MIHALGLTCAIAGPAALLLAALGFQYLGDLAPCPLCIWQRWPHAITFLIGMVFLIFRWRLAAVSAAATLAIGAMIAAYHVGVEQGLWQGLPNCAGDGIEHLAGEQLLDFSAPLASVVDCSQPAWEFLGVSMAAMNALASFLLSLLWLWLAINPHRSGQTSTAQASSSASQ
ncbi:MAG: disulfide bond formation protein B [Rhodobacteraceae bacterium]|nr:disulfide bond formation protein B [Paracoccaceae bacterium]